jgi:hypothetical protein
MKNAGWFVFLVCGVIAAHGETGPKSGSHRLQIMVRQNQRLLVTSEPAGTESTEKQSATQSASDATGRFIVQWACNPSGARIHFALTGIREVPTGSESFHPWDYSRSKLREFEPSSSMGSNILILPAGPNPDDGIPSGDAVLVCTLLQM